MSAPDDSVPAVLAALRDVLEASGVTYAFGGAIALAAWSEPRATADVDVVVWLELDEIDRVIELVREAGVTVDGGAARTSAETRGMFVCRRGATRVDVFLPSIPFYREAALRRVRTAIAGAPAWVHSAEVLAVFKMLFFRGKDLVDLERMLAVQGAAPDRAFVRDAPYSPAARTETDPARASARRTRVRIEAARPGRLGCLLQPGVELA